MWQALAEVLNKQAQPTTCSAAPQAFIPSASGSRPHDLIGVWGGHLNPINPQPCQRSEVQSMEDAQLCACGNKGPAAPRSARSPCAKVLITPDIHTSMSAALACVHCSQNSAGFFCAATHQSMCRPTSQRVCVCVCVCVSGSSRRRSMQAELQRSVKALCADIELRPGLRLFCLRPKKKF